MAWQMWGDYFETADITNKDSKSKVTFLKNRLVKSVRVWLIKYNDPTYTDLSMDVYSVRTDGGTDSVGKLLMSSTNTITKAAVDAEITEDHGAVGTYFEFDDFRARKDDSKKHNNHTLSW